MERIEVDSSNIISIGYDPKSQILELEFGKISANDPTNRIYQYENIPPEVYQSLIENESHGRYLYHHIILKKYVYKFLGRSVNLNNQ